ncbi:hypothetical protein COCSUDRAFT_53394 [Coccomyxa subellipsoidea C-169]|uniref:Uncharacterized protein n=1 Tax=Coccomyxa subellipsoidea (strain C-169) TaxID=574566 RepID=I0YYV4_COCSC|nr:hypothetical protein COCSUDRAFT_53394 [Coccomyxa subellipsoidea C-169]EIE23573.1 hypothetical protein COCSUDRAFT_53394 [Coccomyxa subellipsoidea C-169]|eukprot:XP_005648117.1 hypothetical protein COCSUDRAFT_53394 [Coccomyxa subellipsoidea C-169]
MSTTWGLLCFFQTTVLLTVTCTSDAAHSPLIRTLESEGDFSDCIDSDQLTNGLSTACTLLVGSLVESVKEQAAGSIEGEYFPFMCHDGHLAYASLDSGERILWYSRDYKDWNINAGLEAKPEEVLAFASDAGVGSGVQEPFYSGAGTWWVVRRPGLRTSLEEMFTEAKGLRVQCIEGQSVV